MASINDVFNALNDIKGKLDQLHVDNNNNGIKIDNTNVKLDTVNQTITNVGVAVDARFSQVLQQQQVSNQLVHHISRQQETVICILEHISRNTCMLVNLATKNLNASEKTQENTRITAEVLSGAYPNVALDLHHRDELERKVKECCPDKPEKVPCDYKPCENPGTFRIRDQPIG